MKLPTQNNHREAVVLKSSTRVFLQTTQYFEFIILVKFIGQPTRPWGRVGGFEMCAL